jgi:hypothetical protein
MNSMSSEGDHYWMADPSRSVSTPHHYAIVYLGDNYVKQALSAPASPLPPLTAKDCQSRASVADYVKRVLEMPTPVNGCHFEMHMLSYMAAQVPDRIFFVYTKRNSRQTFLENYPVFRDTFCYRPQDLGRLVSQLVGGSLTATTLNDSRPASPSSS